MARQMKAASIVLLWWYFLYCAEAFTPNRLADSSAIFARFRGEVRSGRSRTHKDITTDAILQVSADLLRDNPNPDPDIDSTARINALTELTEVDLIDAYYGDSSDEQRSRYEDAIEEINEANEETDTGAEGSQAAAHFDSEQLQAGQNRLIILRELTTTNIQSENYERARELAGSMLHALQDFYSHTNWIEMGERAPNSVLGERGQNIQNIASPNMATCSDCTRDGRVLRNPLVFIGTRLALGQVARFYYRCNNNILPAVDTLLTSGYYTGQTNTAGVVIPKPAGKCSHGGFGDPSSDLPATGGINKDSISLDWSPHADLHDVAAAVAVQASIGILQAIRAEVDDDTKFAAFLNLDQVDVSIAYVIDTTGSSMGEELPQIQATIPMIRVFLENYVASLGGNARVRFILVPFNDPDPGITIITEDIDEFLNAIRNLVASGGGDCPEPSIGALIRAIRASERGSPIFVYTDADASDPGRVPEAAALIRETGVRVTYVLTGTCSFGRKRSAEGSQQDTDPKGHLMRVPRQAVDDVYTLIAAISGGQVLNVNAFDISQLSPLISFSLMQSTVTLFFITSTDSPGLFNFPVDESVSEVLISVNGVGITVTVTAPGGIDAGTLGSDVFEVSVLTTETYVAMVNVTDSSLYGEWQLNVTTSGLYSIRITAISDIDFTYTLYRPNPTSNFGFVTFERDPLEGETLILFIQLEGNFEGTEFTEARLLATDGNTIESPNITDIGDGGHIGSFVTPSQPFLIQITGSTDSSGNPISRISSTGVEPTDQELALFSFTSSVYSVTELPNAEAEVTVQLQQGNLTATIQVTVQTVDGGTATVDVDYSTTTCVLEFPAGSGPGTIRSCFIPILDDETIEGGETITVTGSTPMTVLPFTTTVIITDNDIRVPILVNDTIIGDPLFKVPIYVPDIEDLDFETDRISLCYEVHGEANQWFNLVTDECTSVNAHYINFTDLSDPEFQVNIVNRVAVRAVDDNTTCRQIMIDLDGCSVQLDGIPLVNSRYSENGISIRRYPKRVRVMVPNCRELSVIMWITCETQNLRNPSTGETITGDMIRVDVMRGLNFGHQDSHGLIGQYWSIPINLAPYTGTLRDGDPGTGLYVIGVIRDGSLVKEFTGSFNSILWDRTDGLCLYAGNSQAGPIYEVEDPNDAVIDGSYKEYRVPGAFDETGYVFARFEENMCQ